jgi:hypothetical protein
MKRFIAISILALSSLSAYAKDSTVRQLANDLKDPDSVNSALYTGLVAGIGYADPKVCTGIMSVGTTKMMVGDIVYAAGKDSKVLDTVLTVEDEEATIKAALEGAYPCKQ